MRSVSAPQRLLRAPARLRGRCSRRLHVCAMQASGERRETEAVSRVTLLRVRLAAASRACPTGLLRAAAAATSERLYVLCEADVVGDRERPEDDDEAVLRFLTLAYDAVAAVAPRLDARFLLPRAGWEVVEGLRDVDTELVSATADADSGDDAPSLLPRRSLRHDADVASLDTPPSAPATALQALRVDGVRGLLRYALRQPPPGRLLLGRKPPYGTVVVAGTFDRLHAGHRLLLTSAALVCAPDATLFVGVTGDKLTARKRRRELLQPYAQRGAAALAFLRGIRPGLRVQAGELDNPLRGIKGQPEVEAIVVSREVLARVSTLNAYKRVAAALAALLPPLRALLRERLQGLAPYAIVLVELVGQGGAQGKLSSTALREQDAQRLQ